MNNLKMFMMFEATVAKVWEVDKSDLYIAKQLYHTIYNCISLVG